MQHTPKRLILLPFSRLGSCASLRHPAQFRKPNRHHCSTKLLAFVVLAFWPVLSWPPSGQGLHGTAALGIWTPERVVLATDSKIRHLKGEPESIGCKIRRSGRFYFAMSGFYGRPGTRFDAWKVVGEAGRRAKTVAGAVSASERVTLPQLKAALNRVRSEDPAAFAQTYRNKEVHLSVFFAGLDSGRPVLAGWQLLTNGDIRRVEHPGDRKFLANDVAVSLFGEHRAIDATYPTDESMRPLLSEPISAARTLIQLEIDGDSASVGPPRSILEITKSGPSWIEPGVCNDLPPKQQPGRSVRGERRETSK